MEAALPTSAPAAGEIRRVLLVEPFLHVHSFVHYRSAVASEGFQQTQIVIATSSVNEKHKAQAHAFATANPRVELRWLKTTVESINGRLHAWRVYRRAMREVEAMLRRETFDLVAYVMVDAALPFLGLPWFRREFSAHRKHRVSGIVFRDNGLRPIATSFKARGIAALDRWILGHALRNGGVRRFAFFDHICADRARARFGSEHVGDGVDPIEIHPADPQEARRKFGIAPDDFVLLLFGAMSDRKGVAVTLAHISAAGLPRERTVVVLAGPVAAEYRATYDAAIVEIAKHHRVLQHDYFVAEEDIPRYFAAADVVLCVYKNFNGSSGVLLHAASFGKPVMVSPSGVMADAVERHRFGEIVSLNDPASFSSALKRLATLDTPARDALRERALDYARLNDSRRYLSQFL